MDEKINGLYKDYKIGNIDRRSFLKRLAIITGSTGAALALLPVLEDNAVFAAEAYQDDPDLAS